MLLNRLSPLGLLDEMHRSFSLVDQMSRETRPAYARTAFPLVNTWTDSDNFYVEAELPGCACDSLNIFVTDDRVLTIQGERCIDEAAGERNWLRRERGNGSFERQIELPGRVQEERIQATYKNGVLLIMLPKAMESQPRRIQVATV
jgi:HSP20 family protein